MKNTELKKLIIDNNKAIEKQIRIIEDIKPNYSHEYYIIKLLYENNKIFSEIINKLGD